MLVNTPARRAARLAQLRREDLNEPRQRQTAPPVRFVSGPSLADLFRENRAVEYVRQKGWEDPVPVFTRAFLRFFDCPPERKFFRVCAFLTDCDKDAALCRQAVDAGLPLDDWRDHVRELAPHFISSGLTSREREGLPA